MTIMEASPTPSSIRVLIAEDETHLGTILEQFLQARGMAVRVVRDGLSALDTLRQEAFDVALLDVVMPGLDGLEVLRQVRELPTPPEVLIVTGNGTIETAMAALSLGAYDVVTKPYKMAQIDLLVRRAWEKRLLHRDVHRLRARLGQFDQVAAGDIGIDTRFAPLRAVLSMAEEVAATPAPISLVGETGVGKRRFARTLHAWSPRADAPFMEVSVRAVPDMVTALLGANGQVGALEMAGEGTIYVPYLNEVPLEAQELLWRVLDTGRLPDQSGHAGQESPLRVMVSMTEGARPRGTVLEPLWHRVQAVSITLPPLRERVVDIPLLTERLLAAAARQRGDRSAWLATDEAIAALESQPWHGNLHELRQLLERAMWTASDRCIRATNLAGHLQSPSPASSPTLLSLAEIERDHIATVLRATRWHQGRAADQLGISVKTLYRKIREYGFVRPRGVVNEDVT